MEAEIPLTSLGVPALRSLFSTFNEQQLDCMRRVDKVFEEIVKEMLSKRTVWERTIPGLNHFTWTIWNFSNILRVIKFGEVKWEEWRLLKAVVFPKVKKLDVIIRFEDRMNINTRILMHAFPNLIQLEFEGQLSLPKLSKLKHLKHVTIRSLERSI